MRLYRKYDVVKISPEEIFTLTADPSFRLVRNKSTAFLKPINFKEALKLVYEDDIFASVGIFLYLPCNEKPVKSAYCNLDFKSWIKVFDGIENPDNPDDNFLVANKIISWLIAQHVYSWAGPVEQDDDWGLEY